MARFCTTCGTELVNGVCLACQPAQESPVIESGFEFRKPEDSNQNFGSQQDFYGGQNFGGQQKNNDGQNFGGQQEYNGPQNFDGRQDYDSWNYGEYTPPTFREMWIAMKNRMGIGEPESNSDGCYERGMQIVPDNLRINEGEIPIRQYDVAVLRSRLQFMRAEGRLQVTNKRLLFRATGRSLRGRTTLQHEFAVDEINTSEQDWIVYRGLKIFITQPEKVSRPRVRPTCYS